MDTQTTKPFRVPFLIWVFFLMFLLIAGLAVFETVKAETFECLTSNTVINLTQKDCEVIACDSCCQTCPMTCDEGYSCQPDPIDPGEEQQYPPDAAAAWVASLGCSELIDVPLDDPRWGSRENGEVYAREGDGCLSLYWPVGGNALFDISSIVDNPAKWNDYLLSGDRPPGGGDYTVPDGKSAIQFNDGGTGGMTVFQSVDAVGPPPPTGGFLDPYTNPEQAKYDPSGIYPTGQRMMISAYGTNDSYRRQVAKAGFTADGPHYHGGGEYDPTTNKYALQYKLAAELGLKGGFRLRVSDFGAGSVYKDFKIPERKAKQKNQILNHIKFVLGNPTLNKYSSYWYGYQEEIIDRSYKASPQVSVADQRAYHNWVFGLIKANDPKKRPYYVSERGDSGQANMAGNACVQSGVMKQSYIIKANNYNGSSPNTERGVMRQWAKDIVKTVADADKKCPAPNGRPRAGNITLSQYIDPDASNEKNEAWLRKAITYDIFTSLAMGVDGFTLYNYSYRSHSTAALQIKLYNEVLGKVAKVDKAFLWGDDRSDVNVKINSGPTTVPWKKYSPTYTMPSIDLRNIQYGNNRYILLVNNSNESIKLTLVGIPAGLKLLNMMTDSSMTTGATVSPTIEPLGVRLYRVSK